MEEGKTGINLELVEEKLLYFLIDNNIKKIIPVTYHDKIDYDILTTFEDYYNKNSFDVYLDRLSIKQYLDKSEHDRIIHCPNCDSVDQLVKYNCPQCNSTRVRRFELIEHDDCGYVGEKDEFKTYKINMKCPKCSILIRRNSEDYTIIGVSYICDNCGYKFDKPNTSHHCNNCGTIYDYTNSIYKKIYTYTTTKKITELVPVREIRETLRKMEKVFLELEYAVELEGKLFGKSNEEHILSVIAVKEDKKIIVDISPWGKVEDIVNLLGKKMDISPKSAILVDLSEESIHAPLEEIYNIKVLDGKNPGLEKLLKEYIEFLEAPVEKEKKGFFETILEPILNGNRKKPKQEMHILQEQTSPSSITNTDDD
jgi:predicted RNA-binding Zn-ribbon protein involved in translation (DUF1610 family)